MYPKRPRTIWSYYSKRKLTSVLKPSQKHMNLNVFYKHIANTTRNTTFSTKSAPGPLPDLLEPLPDLLESLLDNSWTPSWILLWTPSWTFSWTPSWTPFWTLSWTLPGLPSGPSSGLSLDPSRVPPGLFPDTSRTSPFPDPPGLSRTSPRLSWTSPCPAPLAQKHFESDARPIQRGNSKTHSVMTNLVWGRRWYHFFE